MIRQDDPRFGADPDVGLDACVLFQYFWLANKLTGYQFDIPGILTLVEKYQKSGWIDSEMTVQQPDLILADLGVDAEPVRAAGPDYICQPGEYAFSMWGYTDSTGKWWKHAIGDDGTGHQTYDSLGRSHCGKLGKIVEKRVIKLRGEA